MVEILWKILAESSDEKMPRISPGLKSLKVLLYQIIFAPTWICREPPEPITGFEALDIANVVKPGALVPYIGNS